MGGLHVWGVGGGFPSFLWRRFSQTFGVKQVEPGEDDNWLPCPIITNQFSKTYRNWQAGIRDLGESGGGGGEEGKSGGFVLIAQF